MGDTEGHTPLRDAVIRDRGHAPAAALLRVRHKSFVVEPWDPDATMLPLDVIKNDVMLPCQKKWERAVLSPKKMSRIRKRLDAYFQKHPAPEFFLETKASRDANTLIEL